MSTVCPVSAVCPVCPVPSELMFSSFPLCFSSVSTDIFCKPWFFVCSSLVIYIHSHFLIVSVCNRITVYGVQGWDFAVVRVVPHKNIQNMCAFGWGHLDHPILTQLCNCLAHWNHSVYFNLNVLLLCIPYDFNTMSCLSKKSHNQICTYKWWSIVDPHMVHSSNFKRALCNS